MEELVLHCEEKEYKGTKYNSYYVEDPITKIKLVVSPKDSTARTLLDSYYQTNKLVK